MNEKPKYSKTLPMVLYIIALIGTVTVMFLAIANIADARAEDDRENPNWSAKQITAHEIAESARKLGLPETDPIILRAKELWEEAEAAKTVLTEDELYIMANVMYWEAGNGCCEEHILLVGRVLLNRVADSRFPNDVYSCVVAPRQYTKSYVNGKLTIPEEREEEMLALAKRVSDGEPYDCPFDVIYQDNKKHGTGVYKKFYSELLGSTTYFCYG